MNPGVSFKPYPCGSLSHPSMDAMMKVVKDHDLKPDQIKAVRLRAGNNILEPLRYGSPKTELEAKFSVPFLMSAVILTRRAGMREFTDEFVQSSGRAGDDAARDRRARRGRSRNRASTRSAASSKSISSTDGSSSSRRTIGIAAVPTIPSPRADLKAKFDDCAGSWCCRRTVSTRAFTAIESVDSMPDVRQLVKVLVAELNANPSSQIPAPNPKRCLRWLGFGLRCRRPALQSVYVAGTIGADVSRVSHTDSSFYLVDAKRERNLQWFAPRRDADRPDLGRGAGIRPTRAAATIRCRFHRAAARRQQLRHCGRPQEASRLRLPQPVAIPIPFAPDRGQAKALRPGRACFGRARRSGGSVDLVYLGGVAFSRERVEVTQNFPTVLSVVPPVPNGHVSLDDDQLRNASACRRRGAHPFYVARPPDSGRPVAGNRRWLAAAPVRRARVVLLEDLRLRRRVKLTPAITYRFTSSRSVSKRNGFSSHPSGCSGSRSGIETSLAVMTIVGTDASCGSSELSEPEVHPGHRFTEHASPGCTSANACGCVGEFAHAAFAVGELGHHVAVQLQELRQPFAHVRAVFDEQNLAAARRRHWRSVVVTVRLRRGSQAVKPDHKDTTDLSRGSP